MAKTRPIGAAWENILPDGRRVINVIITNPIGSDFRFTLWTNEKKESDHAPDFNVTKNADQAGGSTECGQLKYSPRSSEPPYTRKVGRPETDEQGNTDRDDPGPGHPGDDGEIPF